MDYIENAAYCLTKSERIMAKKMTGIVAQFGTKGYGFITGDDGEKYFVHQKNVYNKSRLRSDTRVKYKVETSEKGLGGSWMLNLKN